MDDLDHGVLITGFDLKMGTITLKNSWGAWGDGGYFTMPYSDKDLPGACGVNLMANIAGKAYEPPVPPAPPPSPHCGGDFYCPYGGYTCCCKHMIASYCLEYECCDKDSTCTPQDAEKKSFIKAMMGSHNYCKKN